jgi:hypothetical protein
MKGLCGYGRYDDDPEHIGCPRASSDMTPCVARDGHLAMTDWDDLDNMIACVGCGITPWEALVEIKKAAGLTPPSASMGPNHYADQLQKVVRRVTEPANG